MKKLVSLATLSFIGLNIFAQNVGINTTGANPDNSAMLDVVATDKGMLIPRVALTSTNLAGPITAPATSLIVYNTASAGAGATAVTPGFYFWDGASWERFDTNNNAGDWKVTGNGNTVAGTNFLGTTNAQALDFRTNNIERFRIADYYQVQAMDDGSSLVPFYSWNTDPNSGLYRLGADALAISTGGIERVRIASGATVFNQTGAIADFRVASDGNANMIYVDGANNRVGIGVGLPATTLHVNGSTQINALAGAGNRMVIADASGLLATQAIPNGDITGVTAGNGMTGGGTIGNLTLNAVGANGLTTYPDNIRLGGTLIQSTSITQGGFDMTYNLSGTGDFVIQDNGTNKFTVLDNGTSRFGGDVEWRDGNTVGTLLAELIDDGNDGRFIVRENGAISVDLDANTQFVFNEQGFDRNFRIESDFNANMLFVDAGLDRVSVGTPTSGGTFNVLGNSYHSDDIYLRDGAVDAGDILVRIFDSADDGIIDVYEDNARNHRIHGNGESVFNEQGNANGDIRMESDTRTHMFWLDADENLLRVGTASVTSDYQNTTTIAGVVVDYVADFDRGVGATGTAIGIGSIEYLLDASSKTLINNTFSPATHLNRDLGSNTTTEAWDDVYADNFVNVSDEREKRDIQDLTYGLDEVLAMRPVSYILKQDPFEEVKLGLIAQEALTLVPEAVKTHDYKVLDEATPELFTKIEMERMGMTYNSLIPVLIKATQEQQVIIDSLSKKLLSFESSEVKNNKTDFGVSSMDSKSLFVEFSTDFSNDVTPIVSITPINSEIDIKLKEVTKDGFYVECSENLEGTLQFNWIAISK